MTANIMTLRPLLCFLLPFYYILRHNVMTKLTKRTGVRFLLSFPLLLQE